MDTKSGKISVIMPSFNCAQFIRDAVESVFAQSYKNYEIIIVDDGSTDNTKGILSSYISANKVQYYYTNNGGISKARNLGISKASGEYILLLDADDVLMPNAMDETVRSIRENNTFWVIVNNIRVEYEQEEVKIPTLPDLKDPFMDVLQNTPDYNAILFDKNSLEEIGCYDPDQKVFEDWDLYIRLLKKGIPFSYVNKPLYRYQIRRGSITKRKNIRKNLYYMERIYRKHCTSLLQKKDRKMAQLYSLKMWRLGSDYFHKANSYFDTFRCLVESLKYDRKTFKEYISKHILFVFKKKK